MVDNFLQEAEVPDMFQLKADSNKALTQKRQCHLGTKEIILSKWQCLLRLYVPAVTSEDLASASCLVLYVCNIPASLLHIILTHTPACLLHLILTQVLLSLCLKLCNICPHVAVF